MEPHASGTSSKGEWARLDCRQSKDNKLQSVRAKLGEE